MYTMRPDLRSVIITIIANIISIITFITIILIVFTTITIITITIQFLLWISCARLCGRVFFCGEVAPNLKPFPVGFASSCIPQFIPCNPYITPNIGV